MLYSNLIRPLLFKLPAETAHDITIRQLELLQNSYMGRGLIKLLSGHVESNPVQVMGLNFRHPVGLAAGLDKDAKVIRGLFQMGFSHIEVGTLTPKSQPGNDKPRLFRLKEDHALINRMGFNNEGSIAASRRLKKRDPNWGVVGGNVGRNKITNNENAIDDYIAAMSHLRDYVDYFTVNISSPNTPGLRELQQEEVLKNLLTKISDDNSKSLKPRPLAVKISPDLSKQEVQSISRLAVTCGFNGIIGTNTTVNRTGLKTKANRIKDAGSGGLSGRPLTRHSTDVVAWIKEAVGDSAAVIGVGGVFNAQDVIDKRNAGADLVQIYTGFVYNGPSMINNIQEAWIK